MAWEAFSWLGCLVLYLFYLRCLPCYRANGQEHDRNHIFRRLTGNLRVKFMRLKPTIQDFFMAHCTKCHNADKKKGGINFLEWTDFRLGMPSIGRKRWKTYNAGTRPRNRSNPISQSNPFLFLRCRNNLTAYMRTRMSGIFVFCLTNSQIAWSLKDLLQIDRDIRGDLIDDPVGKHDESLQSQLELTAGHMEVYLSALQSAVDWPYRT